MASNLGPLHLNHGLHYGVVACGLEGTGGLDSLGQPELLGGLNLGQP